MSETELKPCPFCAGEKIRDGYIRDGRRIYCADCSASVTAFQPNASESAKSLWNCRPASAERSAVGVTDELVDAFVIAEDRAARRLCGSHNLGRHFILDGTKEVWFTVSDDYEVGHAAMMDQIKRLKVESALSDALSPLVLETGEDLPYQCDACSTPGYSPDAACQCSPAPVLETGEAEPVAWLVRDQVYRDKVFVERYSARMAAEKRHANSELIPLYASSPSLPARDERLEILVKALEPFAGLESAIGPQRAFVQLLVCPLGDDHDENWSPKIREARAALAAVKERKGG